MNLPHPYINGIRINQPEYLTNNWRSFQVDHYPGYSQYIKVQNGVATLISRQALLRCKIYGVVDGFYVFDDDGLLVYAEMEEPHNYASTHRVYPDPEFLRPRFDMLAWTPPIPQKDVRLVVDFLSHCRAELGIVDEDNLQVLFEDRNLICVNNNNLWLDMGVQVPVNSLNGRFCANRLRLIMIDMLRYEHIFMGIDFNKIPTDPRTPLVIGVDWSSCGLIKPS